MAMIHKKLKSFLLISFFSFVFVGTVYGGTYFVGTNGNDSTGDGRQGSPWKTIAYALAKAKAGDTISINDGTYSEGRLRIPTGVSLTSTSKDNTKVKVQPNVSLATPFLDLSSASPGSEGNQTVSYIELDGINGSNRAQVALRVQNRNNVRIHHCNIHDFVGHPRSIEIISTEIERNSSWWLYWPADSQAPGIDNNIDALWPSNPVKNFEFDNNTVTDCRAIAPYHLKNSSFHHNTIDNRNTWGWCFKGTSAFMDNVDIHDNTLLGQKQATGQTAWKVELWLHRNGCEYYNNIMNGYYSITIGKETKIYNNTIKMNPADSNWETAIEFNGQSYSEVYGNYISGAGRGIRLGADQNANGKKWVNSNLVIRDNSIYNTKYEAILATCSGPNYSSSDNTVTDVYIYNNYIDGQTAAERGDQFYRGNRGIRLWQKTIVGSCYFSDVYVEDNVVKDITGYAGVTTGKVSNTIIDQNLFYGNKFNYWEGSTATRTITTDPGPSPPRGATPPTTDSLSPQKT